MSNLNDSITKFEEMLKTNTVFYFDSSDFINISHHYIDEANFSLAEKSIKMGLEQHPNNIDLMLLKSELLIFDSRYEDAYKILNYVEEIDPENREVYLQRATIYSKNNLSEEAIDILKKALLFIDDKIDFWNMIAMEFLLIEDFKSAIPFFKKCLNYDNEDYQSLYNLIFCYDNLGMIDESINELSRILEKRPYSKIAWHQLGKIYYKKDKYKEAISAFDFAIISDDQFVSAYVEKANILYKLNKFNEALDNYRLAIELSEPNSHIYFKIAKCYRKLDNKVLFLKYIKKSIRLEPGDEKVWIYFVKYYAAKGNYRNAKYLISKAILNNHNSLNLFELNAILYYKTGDNFKALNFYYKIIESNEAISWRIWKGLIECLMNTKEWEVLLKMSLRAKKSFPKKSFLDYIICGCLLKNGRINEAVYFYQNGQKKSKFPKRILQFFPEFSDNKTLLV